MTTPDESSDEMLRLSRQRGAAFAAAAVLAAALAWSAFTREIVPKSNAEAIRIRDRHAAALTAELKGAQKALGETQNALTTTQEALRQAELALANTQAAIRAGRKGAH